MFVDRETLGVALQRLYGTAGHLLKIWFTLKHMGLSESSPAIEIDTSNSTDSLKRLFSCGAPDGRFYVPFAHTKRYMTMKHDASRSIIQTTVQRWASSGSVVTCDPTGYLDFGDGGNSKLSVSLGRRYPFGLGFGESGFALQDDKRVCIPITSFAVWYGRQTQIPPESDPIDFLVEDMLQDLRISSAERDLIFVDDDLKVAMQSSRLTDGEIFSVCRPFIDDNKIPMAEVQQETFGAYTRRLRGMISGSELPAWLRTSPADEVKELLRAGAKAVLLYGPPRTGKTRVIDALMPRDCESRCTIQIHDGWGYDHLIEGFKPEEDGTWVWKAGPLKAAIEARKTFIVLEEVNRTDISQALGEVFSLIESQYRGEFNSVTLRSGGRFWIPEDVVFLLTMNTVDKSTEEVDDALFGRIAAVEFPPRAEDFNAMLTSNGVPPSSREQLSALFAEILKVYQLGHGYFAGLSGDVNHRHIICYYKARVRPVLNNYLGDLKRADLATLDNLVDEMFAKS